MSRVIKCDDTGEMVCSYKDYLKTDHWREFREKCISSCGGVCIKCKRKTNRLQIHHNHYKSLGNESISDVSPLCEFCHEDSHDINQPKKPTVDRTKKADQLLVGSIRRNKIAIMKRITEIPITSDIIRELNYIYGVRAGELIRSSDFYSLAIKRREIAFMKGFSP